MVVASVTTSTTQMKGATSEEWKHGDCRDLTLTAQQKKRIWMIQSVHMLSHAI